jgi:hypothetical protein
MLSVFSAVNVMLGLKTLGVTPGCVILEVNAVLFDPAGNGPLKHSEAFSARINPYNCVTHGLTIDPATVLWWMKQSDAARECITTGRGDDLEAVLSSFRAWMHDTTGDVRVWGHGTFEVPILAAAYHITGKREPWRFQNALDIRTVCQLADAMDGLSLDEDTLEPCGRAVILRRVRRVQASIRSIKGATGGYAPLANPRNTPTGRKRPTRTADISDHSGQLGSISSGFDG